MSEPTESRASDDAVNEFLDAYRRDRDEGVERSLADYLARWPGHELAVADAWVAREKSRGRASGLGPTSLTQDWVGPYRTIRLIGRGGQGEVFLAEDSRLRRNVALKVLTAVGPLSDELLVRFRREAELASKLEHPHLCRVYDTGIETGIPYIAMQFVEGEPLSEKIARARDRKDAAISLPSGADASSGGDVMAIVAFVEKVARALQAAHDRGVLHRDIKPGNVMVTPDAEPVVLDFGVARDLESPAHTLTRSGELFGSPAYMAPEQLGQKKAKIDRRTDVYSLGVTLFECLTLRRPFEAPTLEALCHAIATKAPPDATAINPQIPRDLRVVLETALEKDRDHRYRRALEFAEDLARVRERRPIRARPPGVVVRFERWVQRNPLTTSFTAAMLVVLGVGLIGALVLLDRLRTEAAGKATALTTAKTALKSREKLIQEMARLADLQRLRDLEAWEARLWPIDRAPIDGEHGMEAWIRAADRLRARLPAHRAALAALAPGAGGAAPADAPLRWRAETLRLIVAGVDALPARVGAMRRRIGLARRLASVADDGDAAGWDAVTAALAADPRTRGVSLAPVADLVPIGVDPVSRMLEFALPASGAVPERGADGALLVDDGAAIVLVLVPGRTVEGGATLPPFWIAREAPTDAQLRHVLPYAPDGPLTVDAVRDALRRLALRAPTDAELAAADIAFLGGMRASGPGARQRPVRATTGRARR